ncbi:hypothetical protein P3C58_22605 [Mesorhizobium sp. XAP10]|uniref:hypothetical protein n=1 Tax=unclassified Mesorhizobium TaxID=325217 RepID=UPI0023DE7EE0|nr:MULTISPECIES: hypothetical protein [unclassified Mesorhizobium]MDF3154774.1 hypothetical protein [Mesorhizobium sp. XAP10]MDF3247676.1 hypothetical protein [Mesorhizobium sp. XAP4]
MIASATILRSGRWHKLQLQRLMLGLIVPSNLAEVAHVELLTAHRTSHEVVTHVGRLAAVLLAYDRWSKIG